MDRVHSIPRRNSISLTLQAGAREASRNVWKAKARSVCLGSPQPCKSVGCEGTMWKRPPRNPLPNCSALPALRTGGGKHDPYYLGNIGPPAAIRGKSLSDSEAVTQSVKQLIRTLRKLGSTLNLFLLPFGVSITTSMDPVLGVAVPLTDACSFFVSISLAAVHLMINLGFQSVQGAFKICCATS